MSGLVYLLISLGLIFIPAGVGVLAAYGTTPAKLVEPLRPQTPNERFEEQKTLSHWVMKSALELDPENPDFEEVKDILNALLTLERSYPQNRHKHYESLITANIFAKGIMKQGELLDAPRFVKAIQALVDVETTSILKSSPAFLPSRDNGEKEWEAVTRDLWKMKDDADAKKIIEMKVNLGKGYPTP